MLVVSGAKAQDATMMSASRINVSTGTAQPDVQQVKDTSSKGSIDLQLILIELTKLSVELLGVWLLRAARVKQPSDLKGTQALGNG
jgi:hypothetical protein